MIVWAAEANAGRAGRRGVDSPNALTGLFSNVIQLVDEQRTSCGRRVLFDSRMRSRTLRLSIDCAASNPSPRHELCRLLYDSYMLFIRLVLDIKVVERLDVG